MVLRWKLNTALHESLIAQEYNQSTTTGELFVPLQTMFLKRVNFFGKHTTETYVTGHCSHRRRWNSWSEQPRCWNVRNLGVARCLIGQAGRVNHESASSQIFEWMQLLCPAELTSETGGSRKIIADCPPLSCPRVLSTTQWPASQSISRLDENLSQLSK